MLYCYQKVNEIVTMPFPITYAQLCKVLMITFILGCPWVLTSPRNPRSSGAIEYART